jgi:tetraacyldisaccharide-1-P 4'-kinase
LEVYEDVVEVTLPGERENVNIVLADATAARGRRVSIHAKGDGAGTATVKVGSSTVATLAVAGDEVRFEADPLTWALYYDGVQGG